MKPERSGRAQIERRAIWFLEQPGPHGCDTELRGFGFRQVDLIENVAVNLLYNWAYIFILGVQGIRVYKADFLCIIILNSGAPHY